MMGVDIVQDEMEFYSVRYGGRPPVPSAAGSRTLDLIKVKEWYLEEYRRRVDDKKRKNVTVID